MFGKRSWKSWLVVLATTVLAACGGGGGNSGDPLFGDPAPDPSDPTAPVPRSVEVVASATSVKTGGDTITITATVKDAGNVAIPRQTVTFSTDTGALTAVSTTTNDDGVATASFSAGQDKANRTATISVRAVSGTGTVQGSVTLQIDGTKISVAGERSVALGGTLELTATASDSKDVVIPGADITVTSALGNGVTVDPTRTDQNGRAVITYSATRSGTDTVTVSGLGVTPVSVPVSVSGEDFSFVAPAADARTVDVGTPAVLTVRYRRNGAAQAGARVDFAATVGTLSASTATTNASGEATVSLVSTFAAPATVTARIVSAGTDNGTTTSVPLNFVARTPAIVILQLSRSALAPNAPGARNNQADAVAKVTDVNGNPVSDVTVNFSQDADPSGGVLLQASATTDNVGQAKVAYASGATSTSTNAVVLRARIASNPAITSTASLTVNQSAVFIQLGTGNTIRNYDENTYEKTWVASITDANGVRVSGVPLTVKIVPTFYGKGQLVWYDDPGVWDYSTVSPPLECRNEDWPEVAPLPVTALNGILDPGEDISRDGQLTPGNVAGIANDAITTNADGTATITFRYPESAAKWVRVRLTATAIVAGTESVAFREFMLEGLSTDFTDEAIRPAAALSPYGTDVTTCTNSR